MAVALRDEAVPLATTQPGTIGWTGKQVKTARLVTEDITSLLGPTTGDLQEGRGCDRGASLDPDEERLPASEQLHSVEMGPALPDRILARSLRTSPEYYSTKTRA